MSKPILKMVEILKPFSLQVDVSDLGIGVIVLQEENGKKVLVAYDSRKLKQSERSFFVSSVNCAASCEKCLINCWYNPTNPKNDLTCFFVVGRSA